MKKTSLRKTIVNHVNSLTGQIIITVLAGIILLAVIISSVVLFMSKRAFRKTYGTSQEKVFEQIENELNDYHESLMKIASGIDSSWAFRLYLNGETEQDNLQSFQNIYQMERDLEESESSDMERISILVLGTNGNHYLSRTETICVTESEIWASQAVKTAIIRPSNMNYTYSHGAYTATARDTDVVIASKALTYRDSDLIYGVVLVTMTSDNLRKFYDYFVSDHTSFYLVGADGTVFSSDDRSAIGTVLESGWYQKASGSTDNFLEVSDNGSKTVLKRDMSFMNCTIYGVIDNDLALKNLYNMPLLIGICIAVGMLVVCVCLIIAGKITRPLSELSGKMLQVREGNFTEYMPLTGTRETVELAKTYNYMLDDVKKYIDELLDAQKRIRRAEINALQMQINPHYIYNTLASIKWVIYQNDIDKSVETIDAFISLLRNTISNKDELITGAQEVENLRNYAIINKTRYGDSVNVEFYISHKVNGCLVPKMIVQPFVENAFFHAFPSGRTGRIQIVMDTVDDKLVIKVIDDGIGMNPDAPEAASSGSVRKEHFTGIGINNVQERLQLLYGHAYGVNIESCPGTGTTVTLLLPIMRAEDENESVEK